MAIKSLLSVAAVAMIIAAPAANAATYNFVWSADPATDPTIVSSDDPTITAVGTFDINVSFGSAFSGLDISNVSILLESSSLQDFTATSLFATGTLDASGTASFNTFNLFDSRFEASFICGTGDCDTGEIEVMDVSGARKDVDYGTSQNSSEALNAATSLEVAPVPAPAGGLLLLTGLAAAAGLKRWKKHTAQVFMP